MLLRKAVIVQQLSARSAGPAFPRGAWERGKITYIEVIENII
jgi:hypothetical protein